MSKVKTAVKIKMAGPKMMSIGIREECKPLTIPVYVAGLLTVGIRQELEAGTDPFKVLGMVKEAVRQALKSNAIQLMVEMGDKNEDDTTD